jgi:hypothetical protein
MSVEHEEDIMQATHHPASPQDTGLIAGIPSVRGAGFVDAGQVLAEILADQGTAPPSPGFAALQWQVGEVTGEWVATAGTGSDAVALYLPAGLFRYMVASLEGFFPVPGMSIFSTAGVAPARVASATKASVPS